MFSSAFPASGFPFAVYCTVAVLAAVIALRYLELWGEPLWHIVDVVDVAPVCDAFVCDVNFLQIHNDGAAFCFV